MIGKTFGKWLILKNRGLSKWGGIIYLCRCECGYEKEVLGRNLKAGRSKQCTTCGHKQKIKACIAIGQNLGKWLVLKEVKRDKFGRVKYLCRCICGNVAEVLRQSLMAGRSKQCKLCSYKKLPQYRTTHRLTKTKIYKVWRGMRDRCENQNTNRYHHYGGRGIQVCKEWKKFENFYVDMGDIPFKGAQLDRVNPDGNYEKNNCHWVTAQQNHANRRISAKNRALYITIRKDRLCKDCKDLK